MKSFKRLISIVLCSLIVVSVLSFSVSAKDNDRALNYLVLGDSIAKGFGLKNPEEASYGKIVANTNGYNYINHGFPGCTSEDLLDLVKNNEVYREDIEWADIISISVGGNDYLLDNALLLILEGLFLNNGPHFQKIGNNYYLNFGKIIDEIHALNPDAVILVQTLYNAWRSPVTSRIFRQAASFVNNAIFAVYEEKGGFYLVDMAPVFDGSKGLVTSDTIHPTFKANVLMARKVLEKINELGLSENTEPVILVKGEDREYLNEYFPFPIGQILGFAARLATGNLF